MIKQLGKRPILLAHIVESSALTLVAVQLGIIVFSREPLPLFGQVLFSLAYLTVTSWYIAFELLKSAAVKAKDGINTSLLGVRPGWSAAILLTIAAISLPGFASQLFDVLHLSNSPLPSEVVGFALGALSSMVFALLAFVVACFYRNRFGVTRF